MINQIHLKLCCEGLEETFKDVHTIIPETSRSCQRKCWKLMVVFGETKQKSVSKLFKQQKPIRMMTSFIFETDVIDYLVL